MMLGGLRSALHLDIEANRICYFSTMSYKLCLGLLIILAAIVFGRNEGKSQSQNLDLSNKLSRVAREAENLNSKKKNEKKTKERKRNKNRAKRRKTNKGKAKNLRVKKKEGQRKNQIKRKKKGGEKKKRSKKGKINKKGKKRGDKKKNKKKNDKKKMNKKGKKRGDKKKNKKKNDRKKINKNVKDRRNRSTSTVSASCYSQSLIMMKIWKDVVSNFKKQNSRMKSQNKTGGSKSGKKGLFAPTAFKLIDIGGGNRSNLSCGGTYGSDGAKQLGNLTKTLFDCELSVNTSCNTANFPQPNTTFIEACETDTTSFETQVILLKLSNTFLFDLVQ